MTPKGGGYVYILTNPKMPGIVKIGSAKSSPDERARQLSTTGVPAPFRVVGYHWFEDELRIERELQALFNEQRLHPRRPPMRRCSALLSHKGSAVPKKRMLGFLSQPRGRLFPGYPQLALVKRGDALDRALAATTLAAFSAARAIMLQEV